MVGKRVVNSSLLKYGLTNGIRSSLKVTRLQAARPQSHQSGRDLHAKLCYQQTGIKIFLKFIQPSCAQSA